MRAAFLLIVALFALQATGALAAATAECRDGCSDDDAAGQCAPTCSCCACCAHPKPVVATALRIEQPQPTTVQQSWCVLSIHLDADPRDILHIPKRS
jgi:hypothetical protein